MTAVNDGLWVIESTDIPCPEWCQLPHGHPYADAQLGDGLHREHIATIAEAGSMCVQLAQWEAAAGAAGPIALDPPDVLFRQGGQSVEVSGACPDEVRAVARSLLAVADELLPECPAARASCRDQTAERG